MNEREARLLPRLIESLDTLEQPGDIASTVSRIRSILGPGCFARTMLGNQVSLDHPEHDIAMNLRGLGKMLRRYSNGDRRMREAAEMIAKPLAEGGMAPMQDVLLLLVFLRDVIDGQEARRTVENNRRLSSLDLEKSMAALQASIAALHGFGLGR